MAKAKDINDFVDKKPEVVFIENDMQYLIDKLDSKFGGFARRGINRFHSKAKTARVVGAMKKIDGSIQESPFGKIAAVIQYPEMKGKTIWRNYILNHDIPFLFWEELYRQTNIWIEKKEYGEKNRLKQLSLMSDSIGTKIDHE